MLRASGPVLMSRAEIIELVCGMFAHLSAQGAFLYFVVHIVCFVVHIVCQVDVIA